MHHIFFARTIAYFWKFWFPQPRLYPELYWYWFHTKIQTPVGHTAAGRCNCAWRLYWIPVNWYFICFSRFLLSTATFQRLWETFCLTQWNSTRFPNMCAKYNPRLCRNNRMIVVRNVTTVSCHSASRSDPSIDENSFTEKIEMWLLL